MQSPYIGLMQSVLETKCDAVCRYAAHCSRPRGKVSMLNEAHTTGRRREMPLRDLLARMRHDGCGGIAGNAELLTGI